MTLKFYVNSQSLAYCGNDIVASGSKNYLYASFKFSKEWAGLNKTAVFVSSDGSRRYHMLLEGGRCSVPAEMIAEGGFYVSVFGGDRITSTQVYIDVAQSGVTEGLTPPEPTEDVYNQILENIDELSSAIDSLYVTEEMIADGAVTATKIADKSITADKLADDSVTNSKIANGAVTASCIASSQIMTEHIRDENVTTDKVADGAITENKLATEVSEKLHTHSNKSALDTINAETWEIAEQIIDDRFEISNNAYEISEFADKTIDGWYNLPFEVGELFEVYNETETAVSQLQYNDEVIWKFSAQLEPDKRYLLRITQKPVTGADIVNGEVEVIRETAVDAENTIKDMYDLICEVSADVKTLESANDILVGLIEEGV